MKEDKQITKKAIKKRKPRI